MSEIPFRGEIVEKRIVPPVAHRMHFWKSGVSDTGYMARSVFRARLLPFMFATPPHEITEDHLDDMVDRYKVENEVWSEEYANEG